MDTKNSEMDTLFSENSEKNILYFECKLCDYTCSKKQHIEQHYNTQKHKNADGYQVSNSGNQWKPSTEFNCECGKCYSNKSGLWKHKKVCKYEESDSDSESDTESGIGKKDSLENNKLVEYLINENKDFKNLIMELIKKDATNTNTSINSNNTNNNTNNTNNTNNSFNLQVFLNDKCKGAMNMSEFVDTIKMQLSDLENFAHFDYADGVSKILLKNLNNLDTYLRPIHCSDSKRETIYIKENNCWTKEEDDKSSLKTAIKQVAFKNIKQINEWVKENPGCQDPRTKQNVKYNKIVMNSMSGGTVEEQKDNIEKIVKNVIKAVTIEKNMLK